MSKPVGNSSNNNNPFFLKPKPANIANVQKQMEQIAAGYRASNLMRQLIGDLSQGLDIAVIGRVHALRVNCRIKPPGSEPELVPVHQVETEIMEQLQQRSLMVFCEALSKADSSFALPWEELKQGHSEKLAAVTSIDLKDVPLVIIPIQISLFSKLTSLRLIDLLRNSLCAEKR